MKTKTQSFKLISHTQHPIETLFACWAQSRPTQYPELFSYMKRLELGDVVTAKIVQFAQIDNIVSPEDIVAAFKKIIDMPLPIQESIHFTWGFSSFPIEWREQAVRKRQWGFWFTSMREFGMDDFARDRRWALPAEGAVPNDNGGLEYLEEFIGRCEVAYNRLKREYGWPQEIARKVIPLCATHNGTMFSNFRTLLDTLTSRSCWIAQIDLWGPVIAQMLSELGDKVHALLGKVVSPPCFKRFEETYKGCKYKLINDNRLSEQDPYAPCPLYCMYEHRDAPDVISLLRDTGISSETAWIEVMKGAKTQEKYIRQGQRLLPIWSAIWHRNPFTGQLR